MRRFNNISIISGLATTAMLALGLGCLPDDTRPEPAQLDVTASPHSSITEGFSTDDGWTVSFDRFVTALGDLRLEEDSCTPYGETRYEWLFDFTVARDEKVGLVYGLGSCDLEFRLRGPSNDTVLGPGVNQSDLVFMRTELSDGFAEDQEVTLWVIGSGKKGADVKTFEWVFRKSYELRKCEDDAGEPTFSNVTLSGGDTLGRTIEVRGHELFRRYADDDAELLFEPFAQADLTGDGHIEFVEIGSVDAPAPPADHDEEESMVPEGDTSLLGLVYWDLLPRVARLSGGGPCEAEDRDRR